MKKNDTTLKKVIKNLLFIGIYIAIMWLIKLILNEFGLLKSFNNYISFKSVKYDFKDLLSISITILAIFIGAIITAVTILISMCDKRLMKLIKSFNKSSYVVKASKTAILSGIVSTCLYAVIYTKLDFNILKLRVTILLIANYLLFIFIYNSRLLIKLVVNLLQTSLLGDDNIVANKSKFINPKENK